MLSLIYQNLKRSRDPEPTKLEITYHAHTSTHHQQSSYQIKIESLNVIGKVTI